MHNNHEYLIKQTQYSLNNTIKKYKNKIIQLNFFHPITELIFVVQSKSKFLTIPKEEMIILIIVKQIIYLL